MATVRDHSSAPLMGISIGLCRTCILGGDRVDESPIERRSRVDGSSRQREFAGAVTADSPYEADGAACAGDQTHGNLRQGDLRARVRHHMARERGELDP